MNLGIAAAIDRVLLPVGEALDRRRVDRALSARRLGVLAGMHKTVVLRLLMCRNDPRISTIIRAADALGFDVEIKLTPRGVPK